MLTHPLVPPARTRSLVWNFVGLLALVSAAPTIAAPFQKPNPDQPIGDDDPANWSEVAIFRAGATRPKPVVVLRRASQPIGTNDGVLRGLITREIVRQGFLLAAREGFDVVVRDRAVGDPDEAGTADATYRLGSLVHGTKPAGPLMPSGARITIASGTGTGRKVVWNQNLAVVETEIPRYGQLVGRVEELSRTDFRTVLLGWNLPPSTAPKPARNPETLPDGVENQLQSLAETEQFAALRALHDVVRREGGSPTRWLALAHGYAMLGSLTEPLLSVDHAAFKARGLLYAQMAVVAANDSPQTLRAQAFAEVMASFMFEARGDLDLADKADGGKGQTSESRALRAYLATDPVALHALTAQNPKDLLPLYLGAIVQARLAAVTGENNKVCRNEINNAQEEVLARVPDCNRAIDALCDSGGVANLHHATTVGLAAFAETSAHRVAAVPGLPPDLARQLANGAVIDEVVLRRALDKAALADPNDLSWGALAQILRETRFWQVCWRLFFLAYPLGSGAADFAAEARPVLADHPSRDFVDLYRMGDPALFLRKLDFADFEFKNFFPMRVFRVRDKDSNTELYRRGIAQSDLGLLTNQEQIVRNETRPDYRTNRAQSLLMLDPKSPVARSALVANNFEQVAAQIPAWEREQPWNTPLIGEYGLQLVKLKRYAEAETRFETALARSPESWLFRGLADCYREQGQIDKWIRAAENFLKGPDQSLDHAAISQDLAKYLVEEGDADRAWPWVEGAAQSGASWAMTAAWQIAERRRDWPNAEMWVAAGSERYGSQWLEWLLWSLRTGHGHVDQAAAQVWRQWDNGKRVKSEEQQAILADLGLMLNRPDVTRTLATQHLAAHPESTADAVNLIFALDQRNDTNGRDAAMTKLIQQPNPTGPRTAQIIRVLSDWKRKPVSLADALKRVDTVLAEIPAERRPPTESLTGRFLILLGQPTEAIPYLKRADVRTNDLGQWLLARQALQKLKQPLADSLLPTAAARPKP